MDTDKISQIYNELKTYSKQLPFPENDVRVSFFRYASSIIAAFHQGYCSFEFLNNLYTKFPNEKLQQELFDTNDQFLGVFGNLQGDEKKRGYLSSLNRQLILDTWSVFELTITSLVYHLYDNTEISKLLKGDFEKIQSILSKYELLETDKEKIKQLLEDNQINKEHLSHYPITRKCGKVFKKIKQKYGRETEQDLKFLNFYGKYRNCLHFNFIYFGKDWSYPFKNNRIYFVNSKAVVIYDENFGVDLFSELILIFKKITNSLKDEEYIKPFDE